MNSADTRTELLAAKIDLSNALLHINRALGEDDGWKVLADN